MEWLRATYAVPLRALLLLIRIFQFNRAWLDKRLARKSAAGSIKGFIFLTLLVWFAIFLFADNEYRDQLNQAFKSFWFELAK